MGRTLHDRVQYWENMKNSPRDPKNSFPEVSGISFLHLISIGLNGVNINSLA